MSEYGNEDDKLRTLLAWYYIHGDSAGAYSSLVLPEKPQFGDSSSSSSSCILISTF
jgi:hypothetical protein